MIVLLSLEQTYFVPGERPVDYFALGWTDCGRSVLCSLLIRSG